VIEVLAIKRFKQSKTRAHGDGRGTAARSSPARRWAFQGKVAAQAVVPKAVPFDATAVAQAAPNEKGALPESRSTPTPELHKEEHGRPLEPPWCGSEIACRWCSATGARIWMVSLLAVGIIHRHELHARLQ
jgi:hypothetical protein